MELKSKCDAIEKRESEKRQVEDKKHQEEIQALKKTNQQLKVRMYVAIHPLHSSHIHTTQRSGTTGGHHCTTEKVTYTTYYTY